MGLRRFVVVVGVLALLWAALSLALPALADQQDTNPGNQQGQGGTANPNSNGNGASECVGQTGNQGNNTPVGNVNCQEEPNETTTTTVQETTTTTATETTTTTTVDGPLVPTTAPAVVIGTTEIRAGTIVASRPTELPYTGIDPTLLVGLAAALGSSGAYLLRKTR